MVQAVEDCYTIKPSPGKGLSIFAAKALKPADVILIEKAVLRLVRTDVKNTIPEVDRLVAEMDPRNREEFLTLGESPTEYPPRNMKIYSANAFEYDKSSGAIFLKIARCNHSCRPNAEVLDRGDEDGAKLVAIRPIAAGEEVFLCYLGPMAGSRYVRHMTLRNNYTFTCDCATCSLRGDEAGL
jgi:SET domain-containing protein